MHASRNIDMTRGNMIKLVLSFALPLCIGNILQMLYNTVDTMVIGNYCGSLSLAAVGTSSQPVEVFMAIFLGLGTGVTILVSQAVGADNQEALKKTVSTATAFLYMTAVPLTVIGPLLTPFILKFMQVPEDAFALSTTYINLVFLGTLGNIGYNLNAGILRGLGDSSSSLLFLLASCVINILLDLLFVAAFHMDVAGAALATSMAMFFSWFFSILYIRKKYPGLQYSALPHKPDKTILKKILRVGLPLGLNNSVYSIGHVLMQGLINAQGSVFMAGCTIGGKVNQMSNVAITSLSASATTFAGQNLGAKKYDRLKKGGTFIPLFSGAVTLTCGMIITLFFRRPLLSLFNSDPAVLEIGELYIISILPFYWMYAIFNGIIYYANGLGEIKYPTWVNILVLWAIRIPCGYLISIFGNPRYVTFCISVSFASGMILMLCFFRSKRWKDICALADRA